MVAFPQGRKADRVRSLGERHRREAARRVATDLGRRERGIGEVCDAERDDAVGMTAGTTPRRASRSTPARTRAELAIGDAEEHAAAEPGDLRREVHRRPHAVDVHVVHARVDVVATGPHLVEAERFDLHASPGAARRPRSSRPGCSAGPRTPIPGGRGASRRCAAPGPAARAGNRPSKVCGGSTTWSSTEITVYFTARGSGSGRKRSSAVATVSSLRARRAATVEHGFLDEVDDPGDRRGWPARGRAPSRATSRS